ncbi:hypothetical protein EVB32_359 [Rhizobium phage RHph_TM39]|uniref:Uncharacterized protein n=2 Tax=Cuauhnahuacvirus TaxID=3044696 RepID=A0A7S5UXW2_9CAUD|nr:hypothetical protein PQC16_gp277 [Rhizobium phage RHph_TM30]YP_010671512.1 hypothetical protein PQC17_gp278 [Rhizobium phage RHph_Y65]QIG72196.1 hypothetical protein EVB95_383 [Rhizobium phage RHph_TM2_3B]QIG77327.1 hypothetical protein EVB32_359 [Rhizobium phage RHph_TM39]QIG71471.1 hypothetical protein EVB93_384 [Rhizobium phage RHph_TM30]QIG72921.1 hypothetical protein EVB97_383 [Rhizobium phage RHph_Y65]
MSDDLTDEFSESSQAPELTKSIDYAIQLVDRKVNGFNDWRIKEVGLQLALFGLAEVQAKRVSNLSALVYNLESQVFSEDTIRNLEPSKLVGLYKMGVEALNESSSYVRSTLKSIDWGNVEAQLLALAATDPADKTQAGTDVQAIVSAILSNLNVNAVAAPPKKTTEE